MFTLYNVRYWTIGIDNVISRGREFDPGPVPYFRGY